MGKDHAVEALTKYLKPLEALALYELWGFKDEQV